MGEGGEIFVLDMGEPVKIVDLARDLIKLSGLRPDIDIPIVFTGMRPGEKLFEQLTLDEEQRRQDAPRAASGSAASRRSSWEVARAAPRRAARPRRPRPRGDRRRQARGDRARVPARAVGPRAAREPGADHAPPPARRAARKKRAQHPEVDVKGIILAGGVGHPPAPADQGRQQAAPAGLRQADDLLPAQRADAGGDPRGADHLDAAGPAALPAPARRRRRAWACASSYAEQPRPEGLAAGLHHRRATFLAGGAGLPGPRATTSSTATG